MRGRGGGNPTFTGAPQRLGSPSWWGQGPRGAFLKHRGGGGSLICESAEKTNRQVGPTPRGTSGRLRFRGGSGGGGNGGAAVPPVSRFTYRAPRDRGGVAEVFPREKRQGDYLKRPKQ